MKQPELPVYVNEVFPDVIDNELAKMSDVVDALVHTGQLDVCTAFLDALGVATIGQAAEDGGRARLLVGYNLDEIPTEQDIVTFEMAREWQETGEDPVIRAGNNAEVEAALQALTLPSYEVAKAAARTHSKLYLTDTLGIVGSSNATRSGFSAQRELNVVQRSAEAVARLREWFEALWSSAKESEKADFKEELARWLDEGRIQRFAPFHIFAKAIFERYRSRFETFAKSTTDVDLAVFQEEGRDVALSILAEHKCCIIADAVGLGKTYVALGAMQRRAAARPRNQKKILVICPAQLEEVWKGASRNQGIALETESMETIGMTSGSQVDSRMKILQEFALVIVDEAHNFRNPNANRFENLLQMLQGGPEDKEVLLLTATPINNSIADLYSLYRLMTRDYDGFFLKTNLRVPSLKNLFNRIVKGEATTVDLLIETMVCRSRLDIRHRQDEGETIVINGEEVRFPERKMETLEYALSRSGPFSYAAIGEAIEQLELGAYNVENYSKKPDVQRNQRYQRLQNLFKILLLKRLESSVVSFVATAENLLRFSDAVVKLLKQGKKLNNDDYRRLQQELFAELTDDDDREASTYFQDLGASDPNDYNIRALERDVKKDKAVMKPLIDQARALIGANDGKLARLKEVLSTLLPDQKVLIFTYYSDTADYLYRQLKADKQFQTRLAGARMEVITGAGKGAAKTQIVKDFAPKANNVSGTPNNPIQLLISTDVLSEGQNLQDCGYLINYDLHFNPVRMIQRNGRIDRLFSAHKVVTVANFFPEGELEQQLGIVRRLEGKIEQIQSTMPTDTSVIGEAVRHFSLEDIKRVRAGDVKVIDDVDARNPINTYADTLNRAIQLLIDFGIEDIKRIPYGCQSNRKDTRKGVFICVIAGRQENPEACWWLFYPDPENPGEGEPIQDVSMVWSRIESAKPASRDDYHPDAPSRAIRWDVLLDAYQRCRKMLKAQQRDEIKGKQWAASHINKRVLKYLATLDVEIPPTLEARLGRFTLKKDETESQLKKARDNKDPIPFLRWLETVLPDANLSPENPETVPLQVVAYLELVPENEI